MSADRDDRELWEEPTDGPRAVKLLQGYVWHPKDQDLELDVALTGEVAPRIHLLVDEMPRAPFTFFDDGTPSESQVIYQLTLFAKVEPGEDPGKLLMEVAPVVEARLEATPKSVGWQLMEDLRDIG